MVKVKTEEGEGKLGREKGGSKESRSGLHVVLT